MKKLPQIFAASLLALLALNSATAQTKSYPPIMDPILKKRTPTTQPAPTTQPLPLPQPSQAPAPVEQRPDIIERTTTTTTTTNTSEYPATRYRKGHPHGMPPGQAKKRGYAANPSNGGLPPGQAKKAYRGAAPLPGTVQVYEGKHHKKHHKGKGK